MVRLLVPALAAVAVALAGCASHPEAKAPHRAQDAQFSTEEQRMLACLDLRDHIVDLYATEYLTQQAADMSPAEKTAFRDGWANELAKRGTFDRFEQSCFYSLTPRKYQCGMQSQTPTGLVNCMKLSAR